MSRLGREFRVYRDHDAAKLGVRPYNPPVVETDQPQPSRPKEGKSKGFEPLRFRSESGTQEDLAEYIEKVKYEAELQARRIREKAEESAIVIEREAYEKGFAKGEENGLRAGVEEAKPLVELVQHLVDEVKNLRSRILNTGEQELVLLSFLIAQKILQTELVQRPEIIADTVRAALEQVSDAREITVHLHPHDFQLARSLGEEHPLGKLVAGDAVRLVADPTVTRGGCWVKTELGQVDSTLESRVATVVEGLKRALSPLARKRWEALQIQEIQPQQQSGGLAPDDILPDSPQEVEEGSTVPPQEEPSQDSTSDEVISEGPAAEEMAPTEPATKEGVQPEGTSAEESPAYREGAEEAVEGTTQDTTAPAGDPRNAEQAPESESAAGDTEAPAPTIDLNDRAEQQIADTEIEEPPPAPIEPSEAPQGWDEMILDDLSESSRSPTRPEE